MKTITLKEAYEKATPAPLLNNNQHRIQPNLSLLIQAITENDDVTSALLAHAYNMLPELVEALETIHEWGEREHRFTVQWAATFGPIVRAAITKANKVELP